MKGLRYLTFILCVIGLAACRDDRPSGPTSISGQVRDAITGKSIPLANAVLIKTHNLGSIISELEVERKTVDSNGNFHFDFDAEKGYKYKIKAEADYYQDGRSGIALSGKINDNLDVRLSLETLPPITQEGKNTFGFLLNGKAWIPRAEAFEQTKISASYGNGQLNIGALRKRTVLKINQVFAISISDHSVRDTGYYILQESPANGAHYWAYSDSAACEYETNKLQPGILHITRLDNVIAGTFEMTFVNDKCDTVRITEGRFDIKP
jgi:hypothetical protein